jgi:hypothetical protein
VLLDAFRAWAVRDPSVGWSIGDALATAADRSHLEVLLDIARHREYGYARAMVVDSLWRYRRDDRVGTVLKNLMNDPDVSLAAMTALRRVLGNNEALPLIHEVLETHPDARVRAQAAQQIRRAERAVTRPTNRALK